MKSHEIYRRMSPSLNEELLSHLFTEDKPAYKATLAALANQRKLRPIFVERKPRPERHAWIHNALGQKISDEVAMNLLQFWLLKAHSEMLVTFLDGLGIEHDGKGAVDNLPSVPEKAKLKEVISVLLEKYPREAVVVYLHAFQNMDISGWPTLAELLEEDERLQFGATHATA
ncbi:MAG TPA: hypothetical protein VIT91_13040 [Chthoniobacterales bacterium]